MIKTNGQATLECRKDGNFAVRFLVQKCVVFAPNEEPRARELYSAVARSEKGYSSGFNPEEPESTPKPTSDDVYNALAVRQLVRHDIELKDFLGLCACRIGDLLDFVDAADAELEEKVKIKQKLLRFRAQQRLEMGKEVPRR